jgi:ketosteroid isomerase-like protein
MSAESNRELLTQLYKSVNEGRIGDFVDTYHPDLVWHISPGNRVSGTYEGRERVLGMLGGIVGSSAGTMDMHVDEVMASDTRGVVLLTVTAERDGKTYLAKEAHLNEFEGDKIRTVWDLTMVAFPDEYWDGLMP